MIFGPNIEEFNELISEGTVAKFHNGKSWCLLYASSESNFNACNMLSYFKYKPSNTYIKSSGVARISFRGPGYIYHKHSEDGPMYELTKDECKNLSILLNTKGREHETIWQDLIHEFNRLCMTDKYESIMFYNKNNVDLTLNFVPLDQPIPDYSLLKNKVYYSGKPRK